ncbi:hypothetical protein [Bacteroides sp.]
MVKRILFITALLLTVVSFQSQARGRITVGEHQKIEKVATLPDSIYYQSESGKHFDLGCMYTVYEICGIPAFIKEEGVLVGFEGDTYYDLDDEYKQAIKQDIQVEDLDSLNKIPFWDRWGGKLILICVILAILAYTYFRNRGNDDEEEETGETANEEK